MRRKPRTGQDMSRPSAASRGNRHVGLLEDPLHQPLDRHLRDASHRPQVHSARPQVPNRHVLLQLVPELAPDVQVREPDPTVGEDTGQALNAAEGRGFGWRANRGSGRRSGGVPAPMLGHVTSSILVPVRPLQAIRQPSCRRETADDNEQVDPARCMRADPVHPQEDSARREDKEQPDPTAGLSLGGARHAVILYDRSTDANRSLSRSIDAGHWMATLQASAHRLDVLGQDVGDGSVLIRGGPPGLVVMSKSPLLRRSSCPTLMLV